MVAAPSRRAYNRRTKSKGLGDVDWLVNALEPLSKGKTKVLVMTTPAPPRKNQTRDATRNQLVALSPGTLYGFREPLVLVSVIGAGSCIVDPSCKEKLSPLILAGLPPYLAKELFAGLARLHRSYPHGTTHSPHPRTGRTFRVGSKVIERSTRPLRPTRAR